MRGFGPFAILVLSSLALSGVSLGRAADLGRHETESCLGDGPLVTRSWSLVPAFGSSILKMGEWKLPVSPARPHDLTKATLALELARLPDSHAWQAHATIHFEDLQFPFGLPYTFPRIAVSYVADGVPRTAVIDWSDDCSAIGRSIFPNGTPIEAVIDLPGTDDVRVFQDLKITLWGSRN